MQVVSITRNSYNQFLLDVVCCLRQLIYLITEFSLCQPFLITFLFPFLSSTFILFYPLLSFDFTFILSCPFPFMFPACRLFLLPSIITLKDTLVLLNSQNEYSLSWSPRHYFFTQLVTECLHFLIVQFEQKKQKPTQHHAEVTALTLTSYKFLFLVQSTLFLQFRVFPTY